MEGLFARPTTSHEIRCSFRASPSTLKPDIISVSPSMSHLLVIVFVIEAIVHTVNAVGATTINNLVRATYLAPSLSG
jgi:hypothetical protein